MPLPGIPPATYGGPGTGRAAADDRFTIHPSPARCIAGTTACVRSSGASTFTSNMIRRRLCGNSAIGMWMPAAALLTSTSIGPPSAATASGTMRSRSTGSARSAATTTTASVYARHRASVSLRLPSRWWWPSTVRAVITTPAPSAAKRSAIPAPMPRLAPVTIARRPSSAAISDARSDAVEGEHLDRVAAQDLVGDLGLELRDHLLDVLLAVGPGGVGVRVVDLEADVVGSQLAEAVQPVLVVGEAAEDAALVVGGRRLGHHRLGVGPRLVHLPHAVGPLERVRHPADLALGVRELELGELDHLPREQPVDHRRERVVELQRAADGLGRVGRRGRHRRRRPD